jgi:hypothetical protein
MKNHYEILGLESDANLEAIKTAYRKLSLKFHPDKNDGDRYFSDMFRQVNEAYQVLSDPAKRQVYDRQRFSENQPNREQQDQLNQRERELREREQRIREANIKAQAILSESERLMNRKPEKPDTSTRKAGRNGLNQIVRLKYFLWAVILGLAYLVVTKNSPSTNSVKSETKVYRTTHKVRHKRKLKQLVNAPIPIKAYSLNATVVRTPDTVVIASRTVPDSVK